MKVRRISAAELPELLRLYAFLHPGDPIVDPLDQAAAGLWSQIRGDPNMRYYVAEDQKRLVATCMLTVIPNLTRGLRPYGVIENVVTAPDFRRRGFGTNVMRFALEDAWRSGCYKVMLATGSTRNETLRFYEKAGFLRDVKTAFVAYPEQKGTNRSGQLPTIPVRSLP